MKTPLIAATALFAASSSISAQDTKSPELQVLDHFIGTWDIDVTAEAPGAEEMTAKAVSHRSWSTGGKFIRFDDPPVADGPEFHILLTYDPDAGNYPGVMMSGPNRMDITGTWSAETKTMAFQWTAPDGSGGNSTHKFVTEDRAEANGVIKDSDGEVMVELSWTQTRRAAEAAGKAPSVDELLKQFHEAIGGLEANKKITTRRLEGKLSVTGAPQAFEMTSTGKAPNLVHTKVVIPEFGEAFEGSDGKVAWKSNAVEGSVEFEGEERAQKMRDNHFHRYIDLKSDFEKLEAKGRETVDGKSYDILVGTRADGGIETLCFDTDTHLLSIVKRDDMIWELSDYDEVDGIAVARTIDVLTPDGTKIMTVEIESIKHGIEVDDSLFAKPE